METIPLATMALFFLIAMIYASMGFGGGSSYLAALVWMGFYYRDIPPIALSCNLVVSGTAMLHFALSRHLDIKKVLPFAVLSVPMAYLGGRIPVSREMFCLLLGFSLLAVAARMAMADDAIEAKVQSSRRQWIIGLPVGGTLGFLSGLVGIGGGIFLSPLLLWMRWANVKQAAAAASFFIFVNSWAALFGHLHKASLQWDMLLPLALAVFAGGQIGGRLGAFHIPKVILQRMLVVFILYISFKLIWTGL